MPMIPDSLTQWLYTNAPAAWLSALVAIITCSFVLWTRKKPNKIIIQDITQTSLVRVWPSVKSKISLTFDGQPITSLGQVDLEVSNEGSEVIKDPLFVIALPKSSNVLDVLLSPQSTGATKSIENNTVTISIPHLNPIREHGQLLFVSILVDGKTGPLKVTGTGEGWSTRHLSLPTEKEIKSRSFMFFGFMATSILVFFFYGKFLEANFGIRPEEVSFRAFMAALSLFLPIIIVMFLFARWYFRAHGLTNSPRNVFESEGEDT